MTSVSKLNRLRSLKALLPWLSLSWGIFSAALISHNASGIHKFLFFSVLFAIAGLAGFVVRAGRYKFLDWLRLISQQSAAQYILFFALPLLWKSDSQRWLILTTLIALSTLWDPFFNSLWQKHIYRHVVVVMCLVLLSGLLVTVWAPGLLRWSPVILVANCLIGHALLTTQATFQGERADVAQFTATWSKNLWQPVLLMALFFLTATPLPPLGVWVQSGQMILHPENRSIECETHIAAPAGFKSEVVHLWEFEQLKTGGEEVVLPEVSGNGIEEKPYRTRSRKQAFAKPFEEVIQSKIDCSVILPGVGPVGKVSYQPKM